MSIKHQEEAIGAALARLEQPDPRFILHMATGTGKTYTAIQILVRYLAAHLGIIVAWLVDRQNLVRQAQREMVTHAPRLRTELEMGRHRAGTMPFYDVLVGTVQSVSNRLEQVPRPGLVIIDECHQDCTSSEYDRVYAHWKGIPRVGLTATPFDGMGKDQLEFQKWADICFSYSLSQAILDGALVPIKAQTINLDNVDLTNIDYSKEKLSKKDTEELERQLLQEEVLQKMALNILNMPTPCIVFCPSTKFSRALVKVMETRRPGSSRHIDCYMPEHEDGTALADFKDGKYQYASNYRLWTYGVDVRNCRSVVFCCDKNRQAYEQGLGRVSRWCCNKALFTSGVECECGQYKTEAFALDFCDNVSRHTQASIWSALAPKSTPEQREQMAGRQADSPGKSAAQIAAEVMAELLEKPLIVNADLGAVHIEEVDIVNPLCDLVDRAKLIGFALPKASAQDKRADMRQVQKIREAFFYEHENRLRSGAWVDSLSYKQAFELLRTLERRSTTGKAEPRLLVQLSRIKTGNRPTFDRSVLQTMGQERAADHWEKHRHWLKKK